MSKDPDYLEVDGTNIDAADALVDVTLWAGGEDGDETVELIFFDPNERVRCKIRLTDWLAAAFEDAEGAGPEFEARALRKVRDLCDRLIAARETGT